MLEYDHIVDLLKAAAKRTDDALELLEQPSRERTRSDAAYRHLCAAQYLAGYAVECVLKSYIIYQTNIRHAERIQNWSRVLSIRQAAQASPDLSGSRSHSLPRLLQAANLEFALADDTALRRAWRMCCGWSPALRYKPGPVTDRRGTVEMVEACRSVRRWVQAQFVA